MDEEVRRGTWKKRVNILTLSLLCMLVPIFSAPPTPSEKTPVGSQEECQFGEYKNSGGVCCQKCHPGQKLVKDCESPSTRTICETCRKGTYRNTSNYARNCDTCRRCKEHEEEVEPCTNVQDRECRCIKGYYKDVVDIITHQCLKCTTCEVGMKEQTKCTPEMDTVCVPVQVCEKSCQLCNCTAADCKSLNVNNRIEDVDKGTYILWPIMFASGILFAAILIIGAYQAVTLRKKRKLCRERSTSSTETESLHSQKSTQKLMVTIEKDPNRELIAAVHSPTVIPESELPKEIKISDLIYSVLGKVQVRYIKQLVRSLGVSEREIEWALENHRNVADAHYKMFQVWAEAGAGREVLTQPLLQDLLEKLTMMHLNGIAEELEKMYGDQ